MKQINYKTITAIIIVVIIIMLLLTGLTYYFINNNQSGVEEVKEPIQKVEVFDPNTYYTEYYMNINNIVFSDDFKKDGLTDDAECSLSYSLSVNLKENSKNLYDGLCSNMSKDDFVIDDVRDWGKVEDGMTVVDKTTDSNDAVYMFLSIVDGETVSDYVVGVPVMSLNYSVIDNILRFEKDAEIVANSFDDVVLKVDNGVYKFE